MSESNLCKTNINDLISIVRYLISYPDYVNYEHIEYKKFHEGITHFVIENDFENTEEWINIKQYLLINSNQFLSNGEANFILENLEELKRRIIRNEHNKSKQNCYFDIIHPIIKSVSKDKFFDGHYADSVESAFKEINVRLKSLYRKYKNVELDGKSLMFAVFNSDNKNQQRLLTFESLNSESALNIQEGFMYIFAGAMQAIRNPKAHANTIISKDAAIERLLFASMLMKKIDESVKYSKLKEDTFYG